MHSFELTQRLINYIYFMSFKFYKREKLKSRKLIGRLFSEGKSVTKFPVRMLYLPSENTVYSQAAFSVPKRNFKLAVGRNRIKRQIREAYRLNKSVLNTNNGTAFALVFLYIGRDKTDYGVINNAVAALLKKLQQ